MSIELEVGQQAVFCGSQRSGKSNVEAFLVEDVGSVVVFDSSVHPDEWARWGPPRGYVVTSDPAVISHEPKVVYQVPMPALRDVQGWRKPGSVGFAWTRALEAAWRRGHSLVIFDEAVHSLPAGRPHEIAVQLYTQGAKHGLTVWAGTQWANRIETAIVRAAVHCFAFRLGPYDLGLLAKWRDVDTTPLQRLGQYEFGYHLTNTATWQLCAKVAHVMGKGAPVPAEIEGAHNDRGTAGAEVPEPGTAEIEGRAR